LFSIQALVDPIVTSLTVQRTNCIQDEVAYREETEQHLKEFQATSHKSQIYQSFIDHPAPKMAEMSELVVARLQATQHLTSTNDYDNDALAVHSALETRLPSLSHFDPCHMHEPQAEDTMAPAATTVLGQMSAVTVIPSAVCAHSGLSAPRQCATVTYRAGNSDQ
jgi:hypothetical protein